MEPGAVRLPNRRAGALITRVSIVVGDGVRRAEDPPAGDRMTARVAMVVVLLMVTAACGSRLSRDELLAGAKATSGSDEATLSTGGDPGTGADRGVDVSLVDPGETVDTVPGAPSADAPVGSGGATAGGGTGGSVTAQSCTSSKSPIVIGSVGEITGIVGANVVEGTVAVKAWAASVNAKGGINCHPVRYIPLDDGGDPSRNQSLTQQLVEREGAIALVFNAAPLAGNASVNYLNQRKVPAIGSETASDWWYKNPMLFPQGTSGLDVFGATFSAVASVEHPKGHTKMATLSCVEASLCSQIFSLAPELTKRYGFDLVYRAQGSLAQPDYTANCQAAKDAGAQVFYAGLDSNSVKRLARSCASINYRPTFAIANLVTLPELANDPLLDGLISAQNTAPWTGTSIAGVAEFVQALRRYAPGHAPSSAGMAGWTAAKVFELAASKVKDTPTSQQILEGLWAIQNNDLGGITAPLTFKKGASSNPLPLCYWITQIKGGKFVSPNGSQRVCA